MKGLVDQHFELTNLAMGMKGSSIQYNNEGQVVAVSMKTKQDEIYIENVLADTIWQNVNNGSGYVSIKKAKKFCNEYF